MAKVKSKEKGAEVEVVSISSIKVSAMKEISNRRKEIKKLIKDNPLIEITDNASYEQAKKNRTALKSGRTGLAKEEKELLSQIKTKVVDVVKGVYAELRDEVTPAEIAQQEIITPYEEKKEAERQERLLAEENRRNGILERIDEFFENSKRSIEALTFEASIDCETINFTEENAFEEFQPIFEAKLEVLEVLLAERKRVLQDEENARLEQVRIAEQNAETARLNQIETDRLAEIARKQKEQADADAEKKRLADAELEKEKAALKKEKEDFTVEKRTARLQAMEFYDIFTVENTMSIDDVRETLLAFNDEQFENYIQSIEKSKQEPEVPVIDAETLHEVIDIVTEETVNNIEVISPLQENHIEEVDFEEQQAELTEKQQKTVDFLNSYFDYCDAEFIEPNRDGIEEFVRSLQ